MSVTTMFLRDGPVFKTGSEIIDEMTDVIDNAQVKLDVGQEDEFSVTVPLGTSWLSDVKPGRVAHLTTREDEYEWWVSSVNDGVDADGGAVMKITFDPFYYVLADVGIIETTTSGGVSWPQGGIEGSPKNFVTTYILPHLTTNSIDYFAAGTFDVSTRDRLNFSTATPLALIKKIATKWELEWRVRRDTGSSKYDIDFLTAIGSGSTTSWASEALNILRLERERTRENLRTVIRPLGALPSGSDRAADIGQNLFRCSAKPSTHEVTAEAVNGRSGPILEDDQWKDLYLQLEDGSYEQITATVESTQTFTLNDGSGVSVGDLISIVKDSSGTRVTEMESPSGVADFGRIQGPFETDRRGEANWVKNAVFHDWSDPEPWAEPCQVAGGQTTVTSVDLDGLPASFEIKQDDVLLDIGTSTTGSSGGIPLRITADATANGSGEVTVSISETTNFRDNSVCLIYRASSVPDTWTRSPAADTGIAHPYRRPKAQHTNLTGQVDGAQTVGGTTKLTVDLKGLGADAELYAGDFIHGVGGSDDMWVVEAATADGSGNVTVNVQVPTSGAGSGLSLSDNDAVTVYRPLVRSEVASDYIACHPRAMQNIAEITALTSTEVTVNAISGETLLWASCGFSAMANDTVGWASTGDNEPPRLSLMSGGTEDSGIDADDWAPTADGETQFVTLRTSKDFTSSAAYGVRLTMPMWDNSGGPASFNPSPWIYPHWLMLHIGVQSDPAPVWGSHATDLLQDGNLVLADSKDWDGTYTMRTLDLAEVLGVKPSAIRPTLGGNVQILHATSGIEATLRIVQMAFNPFHPEDVTLVLDRRPDLITRRVRKQKPKKLFARVETKATLASGEEVDIEETVVPEEEPPDAPGVPRAFALTAAQLTSDDALDITFLPEDD